MTDVEKENLFLCAGNSAGFLRQEAGDQFEVFSAGTKPSIVRPETIAVMIMNELGIDMTDTGL